MEYDAVLFDFDGVLVEPPSLEAFYEALRRVYDSFDLSRPSKEEVSAFFAGNLEAISRRCRQLGIDINQFCGQAAKEAIRTQRKEIKVGMRSAYEDISALVSLSPSCGVVSDNHPSIVSMTLQQFGIARHFETIHGCPLTPTGFKRRKPNPYNLEAAMVALDVEPDRVLYVGDQSVDIDAADNAGVDSAYLSRDGSEVDRTPTYQLSSLRELPTVIGQDSRWRCYLSSLFTRFIRPLTRGPWQD